MLQVSRFSIVIRFKTSPGINFDCYDVIAARPRKHELIIRENQPVELPPDVARGSNCEKIVLTHLT